MKLQFPWLGLCIKEFDVTNIGKQYSLKNIIKDRANLENPLENTLNLKKRKINSRKL